MSYIKREPLLQIAKELQGSAFGGPLIVRAIEEAPAEDVVAVIKCQDCKYALVGKDGKLRCDILYPSLFWVESDDFCSCAERKEDND
jgi:hypothetical protein